MEHEPIVPPGQRMDANKFFETLSRREDEEEAKLSSSLGRTPPAWEQLVANPISERHTIHEPDDSFLDALSEQARADD